MSNCMSFRELGNLIKYIADNHSPTHIEKESVNLGWKQVTYFHPNIDFRTMQCFSVTLRGDSLDGPYEVDIHTQNEFIGLDTPLYDRITDFLQNKDSKTVVTSVLHQKIDLDELSKRVVRIVERQACISVLDINAPVVEYGADSLDLVEIVMALEDEFDFEAQHDYEYDNIITTQDAINLVTKYTRFLQQQ